MKPSHVVKRAFAGPGGKVFRIGEEVDALAWEKCWTLEQTGFIRPVERARAEALHAKAKAERQEAAAVIERERSEEQARIDQEDREARAEETRQMGPNIIEFVEAKKRNGRILWSSPESSVDLAQRVLREMDINKKLTPTQAWERVSAALIA